MQSIHGSFLGALAAIGVSLRVHNDGESKHLYADARLHTNKTVHLGEFSTEFSDAEIICNEKVQGTLADMYGIAKVSGWCVV